MPSQITEILTFACTVTAASACLIATAILYVRQRRYERALQAAWEQSEEDKHHREEVRRAMARFMEYKTGHERILTGAHHNRELFAQSMRERFNSQQSNDKTVP